MTVEAKKSVFKPVHITFLYDRVHLKMLCKRSLRYLCNTMRPVISNAEWPDQTRRMHIDQYVHVRRLI